MVKYIIIGIALLILSASLITVIPERIMYRNSLFGRMFRFVRIRLREMSRTSFCVTAMIMIFIGLIVHISLKTILIALGILLLALVILHPEDFISMFRKRKKAVKKHEIAELKKTPVYKGRTPLASQLTPLIADEKLKG